jgi:hypothetical protein
MERRVLRKISVGKIPEQQGSMEAPYRVLRGEKDFNSGTNSIFGAQQVAKAFFGMDKLLIVTLVNFLSQ